MVQQNETALIVEDDVIQALELNAILLRSGYHVLGTATSAEEAMNIVDASIPQLAVIDVNLTTPTTGIDLARYLSDQHGTRVVIVTGDPQYVVRTAPEFAEVLISKPFLAKELIRLVHESHCLDLKSGKA